MNISVRLQTGFDDMIGKPVRLNNTVIGNVISYNKENGQTLLKIITEDNADTPLEKLTAETIFVSNRSDDLENYEE